MSIQIFTLTLTKFKNLKKLIFLFLSLIIIGETKAQDPAFSQFYSNQLYLNPAFTGINKGLRLGMDYRSQWPSVSSPFTTYNVYGDIQDFNLGGGIGFMAMQDIEGAGALKTTTFGGFYSYRLVVVSRKFDIQAGFGLNYTMKSVDWSRFVFSDQLDPVLGQIYQTAAIPPQNTNRNFIDADAGVLAKFNISMGNTDFSNTLGFAAHHLTQPNESLIGLESRLPMKFTVHYGTLIPLQGNINWNNFFLSPNFIWEQQDNFNTFNFGFYVLKAPVYVGAWYRDQKVPFRGGDAFIANIGVRFENNDIIYQLGYSYDLTVSNLAANSGGAHEISVVVQFGNTKLSDNTSTHGLRKSTNCYKFGNGFLGL